MDAMTISGDSAKAFSDCKPGDKYCVVIGAEPEDTSDGVSVGIEDAYKMDGDSGEGETATKEAAPMPGHGGVAIILGHMRGK